MRHPYLLTALALLATTAANARDTNRQRYLIGERAGGMGGAFVAMTGDPASAWYNPAGLAALREKGISLSASAYQLAEERYEGILDIQGPTPAMSIYADAEGSKFSTFPSSIIYTLPLDAPSATEHHVLAFAILVPDYDRMTIRIDRPPNTEVPFEFAGQFFEERATYWVGPSYAFSEGPWQVGVSAYALAHFLDLRSNIALKASNLSNGNNSYVTSTLELSSLAVTGVLQAGVQYALSPRTTLGAVVRSPTLGTLHDDGKYLLFRNTYNEDANGQPVVRDDEGDVLINAVDRFETDVEAAYKLPAMVAVGISHRQEGEWALAADATLHLPLDDYALYTGPLLFPRDPRGQPVNDLGRAVSPEDRRAYDMAMNVNLGAEAHVGAEWWLRGGLFTDRSTLDRAFYKTPIQKLDAALLPEVNRYGVSLGLGGIGEKSTTSLNVVYVRGTGEGFDLNALFGLPAGSTDVTSQTLTVTLAGSADL